MPPPELFLESIRPSLSTKEASRGHTPLDSPGALAWTQEPPLATAGPELGRDQRCGQICFDRPPCWRTPGHSHALSDPGCHSDERGRHAGRGSGPQKALGKGGPHSGLGDSEDPKMRTEFRPMCQACVQRFKEVSQMRARGLTFRICEMGTLAAPGSVAMGHSAQLTVERRTCWQSVSLWFLQSPLTAQAGSRNAGADVIRTRVQPPSTADSGPRRPHRRSCARESRPLRRAPSGNP